MELELDKQDILEKCMLLGVHVTASVADLKLARNRLIAVYKIPDGLKVSSEVQDQLESKLSTVINTYEFLIQNHQKIDDLFKHIRQYTIMTKSSRMHLSHWVYVGAQDFS